MRSLKVEEITTLTPVEEVALKELVLLCDKTFNLKKVILYGSKARGDYEKGSDVDVLVFVGEEMGSVLRSKMSDVCFDVNYKYGSDLSCIIRNEKSFYEEGFVSLITEAKREGILIEY